MAEWRASVIEDCPYCGATRTLTSQYSHSCDQEHESIREEVRQTLIEMRKAHVCQCTDDHKSIMCGIHSKALTTGEDGK